MTEQQQIASPQIAPPDPNAVDTRDLPDMPKRRRRKGDDDLPAGKPIPKPAKKAKGELWGFDDEEDEGFAEWKLGLILVLSLMAGFGVVAWKKYDTIKAIAAEKIEKLTGGEGVAAVEPGTEGDSGSDGVEPEQQPGFEPPNEGSVANEPPVDLFAGSSSLESDPPPESSELPTFALNEPAPQDPPQPESDWASAGDLSDPFAGDPAGGSMSEPVDQFGNETASTQPLGAESTFEVPDPTEPPAATDSSFAADPFAMPPAGGAGDTPTSDQVAADPQGGDPLGTPLSDPMDTQPPGASFALDPVNEGLPEDPAQMPPSPDTFELSEPDPGTVAGFGPVADPVPLDDGTADGFEADPFTMSPVAEPTESDPSFTVDAGPTTINPPTPLDEPPGLSLEPPPAVDPGTQMPVAIEPLPTTGSPTGFGETPSFDEPSEEPVVPQRVDIAKDTRTHAVENGETFWSISKSKYGTPRYFAALAEWNRETVRDANSLRPGVRIELPPADVLEPLIRTARVPDNAQPTGRPTNLPPRATQDRQHVVQSGETYWSIAKTQYGTVRYFGALAEWNRRTIGDPAKLKPGRTIELPAADKLEPMIESGAFPATVASDAAPNADTGAYGYFETRDGGPRYRVGPTDTLSGIAQATLGRASRWRQIYAMNRDTLTSPDVLPKEAELKLPPDAVRLASRQ